MPYPTLFNPMQYPNGQTNPMNFGNGSNGFQMPNIASAQQVQQRPFIFGRVVNKIEDITPNDVPMDGTFGYFPLSDGTAIIGKSWNSNGTINTIKYCPVDTDTNDISSNSQLDELKDYLDKKFESLKRSNYIPKKKGGYRNDRSSKSGFNGNSEQSTDSKQPS